jgi:hypothetical protein
MIGTRWIVGLGAALAVAAGCKQESGSADQAVAPAAQAPVAEEIAQPAPAATAGAQARQVEKAPPPRLYDAPVERRLYSDRIESSSFLWTDWNKFQENYHPNYAMDGDPATAWVEGADSSGKGEWLRIQLSPVEGVTRVRLRLQNGYHKSRSLHRKNARARRVTVTALPAKHALGAELTDDMGWQEIAFDVPAGRVDALEISVDDVIEGSKYTDLCISDVEVFLTGLTVENPAFEKSKLDELLAWKKNRLAAAALFGSKKAAALPILPGYRVVNGQDVPAPAEASREPFADLLTSLAAAVPGAAASVERARAAVRVDFSGWLPVQLVARPQLALPAVDGLYEPGSHELVYEPRTDAFMLPSSPQGVLLSSRNLSLFDTKEKQDPRQRNDCKEGKTWFMRPPRGEGEAAGPAPREILMVRCVVEETREGEATYAIWQLLEFDEQGNLVLMVGPQQVQWLEWKAAPGATGGASLAGGARVAQTGQPLQQLVDARVAARD